MKTKIAVLVFVIFLLASCAPESPTQESRVDVVETSTKVTVTQIPPILEPIVTEKPVATESPIVVQTETPTEAPFICVTLLAPINGTKIPPVGKVTFSWTPMDKAGNYVLNIILPSGDVAPFETDQTFNDRYMEAFFAGGEYKWQVIVQSSDGNEICVSKVSTFEKPAYKKPKDSNNSKDGNGGSNWTPPPEGNGT